MRQQVLFQVTPVEPDICRNRHGGSDMSILADKRVQKGADREQVFALIKAVWPGGRTLDEVSVILNRPCNCISGRFSELKKAGRIAASETTRKTRTGSMARVYVVAQ